MDPPTQMRLKRSNYAALSIQSRDYQYYSTIASPRYRREMTCLRMDYYPDQFNAL